MTPTTIEVKPINTNSANEIATQANELTKKVSSLKIIDQQGYVNAAELLRTVKALSKKLEDTRKGITSPLDVAKKAVMDLFRAPSDVLETAEKKIKDEMIIYSNEQDRIRKEQEAKLQREAEEKARKEQERLNARAEKAEAKGNTEKAEELREQAQQVQAIAPVLAPTVDRVAGISQPKIWKARIKDFKKIPAQYLCLTEKQQEAHLSYFNTLAKSVRDGLQIEGVEFYSETTIASR